MSYDEKYAQEALLDQVGKEKQIEFYLFPKYCKGCGLCIIKCPVPSFTV